jgi:hypothetical protein
MPPHDLDSLLRKIARMDVDIARLKTVESGGGGAPGGIPPGYFGDGHDGDVTISADTTLTSIMYYDNLTIDAGKALDWDVTNGYAPIVFVKDTLTINGTIRNNAADGGNGFGNSGSTHGIGGDNGIPGGLLGNNTNQVAVDSGNGGDAGQNGGDGSNTEDSLSPAIWIAYNQTPLSGAAGGNGSGAGAGTGGAAGAASSLVGFFAPVSSYTVATQLVFMLHNDILSPLSTYPTSGSGGGAGGANDGGGGGGGGGGMGGNVSIIAQNIVWGAAGLIEATGGNGGNGGNSDGDGGGGGGGAGGNGGIVILCYATETGTRNVDVSGGDGGTGGTSVSASAGANGPDGYDGVVIDLGL